MHVIISRLVRFWFWFRFGSISIPFWVLVPQNPLPHPTLDISALYPVIISQNTPYEVVQAHVLSCGYTSNCLFAQVQQLSKNVTLPACGENHMCNHACTEDATNFTLLWKIQHAEFLKKIFCNFSAVTSPVSLCSSAFLPSKDFFFLWGKQAGVHRLISCVGWLLCQFCCVLMAWQCFTKFHHHHKQKNHLNV